VRKKHQSGVSDRRSTDELIAAALAEIVAADAEGDDPEQWKPMTALNALQTRGGQDVFARAKALCQSSEPIERRLGASILGQLGAPRPASLATAPFYAESVAILLEMLAREKNAATLGDIAIALGHRHDPRAIPLLIGLRDHPDAGVRFGVVFGLMAYEDADAIKALIALSADEDDDVRDWATFALGSQIETDTPAIREALAARLTDANETVRGEALVGLARRHDPRVNKPLLSELTDLLTTPPDEWGTLPFEAAEESGDPRFHAILMRLAAAWDATTIPHDWRYKGLRAAIQATTAENP